MGALQSEAQAIQRACHAQFPLMAAQQRKKALQIDMGRPERVGLPGVAALTFELAAIVIAPTRPGAPFRFVGLDKMGAGFGKGAALVHPSLGQGGQLGAKGADRRPLRPYQNTFFFQALASGEIQRAHPDFDDVADHAAGYLSLPTGGLDVDDDELIQ